MEQQFAREYLPFLPGWTLWVMYPIVVTVLAVLAWGLLKRARTYRAPLKDLSSDMAHGGSIRKGLADSLLQRRVAGRRYPAIMHMGIFYGMILLAIGTTLVFFDEDILRHLGAGKLMSGWFYGLWELILDLAGLMLVLGVTLAFVRRVAQRPTFLPLRRETLFLLTGLLFMGLSGFLLEGYRLNVQGIPEGRVAFAGAAIAAVLPDFDGVGGDVTAYRILWWSHFAAAMVLIGAVAFTGLSHILTIPFHLSLQDSSRPRTRLITPFNLLELDETDDDVELTLGTETTDELSPPTRLGLDACVACGRCHAECPAVASGRDLSPRDFVQELQTAVRKGDTKIAAEVEDQVWACTNCYACEQACPAAIRHVDLVLDFRRSLVDQNRLDAQKSAILEALDRNQNPYKLPSFERAAWLADEPDAEELLFPEPASAEYLYWLGCSAGFDSRTAQVAVATIRLLREAGLAFTVLGQSEVCCGEPAKRLGEEGRFQMIAMENMEVLRETGVREIITHCPHCLNTLGHEYGSLGFDIPVVHHTTLLARLQQEGRLRTGSGHSNMVYHDPCNLGRADHRKHSSEIDQLLGEGLLRPEKSGCHTFCCGGGAGNMWYSVEPEETRISRLRLQGLLAVGSESIVTSCPFCLSMLTDAAGSWEGKKPVIQDVAEALDGERLGGHE